MDLPIPRLNSNVSVKTNVTNKSSKSLNPSKLKGLRNELFLQAVKGQQINSNTGNRNKSTSDVPKIEGL